MTLSDSELISSNIKTASQPSKLKITDMRLVRTTTGGRFSRSSLRTVEIPETVSVLVVKEATTFTAMVE